MLKKVFSSIIITSMLAVMLPMLTASAATGDIQNLNVTVGGTSITTFYPGNGEVASVSFTLSDNADIHAYVVDMITAQTVALFADHVNTNAGVVSYTWYGRSGNTAAGAVLPDGDYQVLVFAYDPVTSAMLDYVYMNIAIDTLDTLTLSSFTANASGGGNFDPSPLGSNETLDIDYSFNQAADTVSVVITNSDNDTYKSFSTSNSASGIFVWDGEYGIKLVDPGTYTVELTATKSGSTDVTSTKYVTVSYDSANKPTISSLSVSPSSFDPDFEDTEISFTNDKDSYLIVEIQDNDTEIRDFTGYEYTNYNSNESHTIVWDGKNNSSNEVSVGTYTVYVRAESDYGVVIETLSVNVDDDLGNLSSSNSHIGDISFSPSTFEPAEDDEVEIEFDVNKDLDELRIVAVYGSQEIELYDESDVDEENNVQIFWDGTDDDDDYVAQGTWKIVFYSEVGSTHLEAAKTIDVEYEKPQIDDLYLSKDKFDNDLGEFTYVLFRVDSDALVDIYVLEDGDEDDEITEDMEVEADRWYAVEWDGGGYDYDDDLDIKLIAKNTVNEDIYDSEKISVDLAEDDVSSSKSNVTEDFISPVLTDGTEYMSLYYNLEDDADVTITIHKGTSTSGSKMIELIDVNDQDSGDHEILWDGRDDDGDKLNKGIYTYKIVSKLSSTETESGHFIVGTVGDIDGGASSSSDDDDKIGPNVIVDGYGSYDYYASGEYCAGYTDVYSNSLYCDAIAWTTSERIFLGYSDNTFKPYDPINRVELLKVILEAYNANILPDDGTNLGFIDVTVGAWYMPYIRTGKALGVFHGDLGYYTARPGDTVNRVEALKMIFETLDAQQNYDMGICSTNYEDVPYYAWYYDYACESYKYNLFVGTYLYPSSSATRGEVAELLYKMHNVGVI